ncbi:aspartate aminotransferase family protein [Microvirga sp. W0021]|uniref:Acetylornithine aminotransferase n=1 Tax=Hohaiivirga grylli TaxID=3133970 RepID=A0ABV0BHY9_9HYPH
MNSPLLPTYARADVLFERGEGPWLFARGGERYLDFGAGVAVNALGHAHPHLVKALNEQGSKLWHTSNLFRIPEGERLAQRLVDNTFADVVFFTNSGAEANECAIKMARKYHASNGQPERFRIITIEGAFHGRTLATIAAGGQQKYIDGFGPKVEGFDQVPFNDEKALLAAITPETAAIMIEPIQGESGIRSFTTQMIKQFRELCDKNGMLLIFDEVQTGVGRTGKLFAHEWANVTPDIMSIAKGIGGGFPLGACLATSEAAKGMTLGTHGSTFGGNPLAMAIGNAVLDIILEPGFLEHVRQTGINLKQKLAALKDSHPDIIEDIRGEGLMIGLKVKPLNTDFISRALKNGLVVLGAGDNVVRLLPPLIIGDNEINKALSRLDQTCSEMETK